MNAQPRLGALNMLADGARRDAQFRRRSGQIPASRDEFYSPEGIERNFESFGHIDFLKCDRDHVDTAAIGLGPCCLSVSRGNETMTIYGLYRAALDWAVEPVAVAHNVNALWQLTVRELADLPIGPEAVDALPAFDPEPTVAAPCAAAGRGA
ncbi:hypothetical protein [Kaistia nematophila]|uniref:Uncharacterized protein n=1 Tax=Kaistia nematophila TaxID=2994654 RepID=A0A9X3E2W6_9HYPH|nr:hypothetical protein [Kaistia nematophila]